MEIIDATGQKLGLAQIVNSDPNASCHGKPLGECVSITLEQVEVGHEEYEISELPRDDDAPTIGKALEMKGTVVRWRRDMLRLLNHNVGSILEGNGTRDYVEVQAKVSRYDFVVKFLSVFIYRKGKSLAGAPRAREMLLKGRAISTMMQYDSIHVAGSQRQYVRTVENHANKHENHENK